MSTDQLGLAIECLVAVLLAITIGYCALLNHRLKRLRADEHALKTTIVELVNATNIADRAISGLRSAATECELGLGQRLAAADRCAAEIATQIRGGETILNRIALITEVARKQSALQQDPAPAMRPVQPGIAHAPMAFAVEERETHEPRAQPSSPARATAALAEALAARARLRVNGAAA